MAFLGAYYQNKGLLSTNGLIPCTPHMNNLISNTTISKRIDLFTKYPSILWLLPITKVEDTHMEVITVIGLAISFILMMGIQQSSWILFLLWILDFSIVTYADQTSFYSYGWESQLLETGFLCIFLTIHKQHPSKISLWLLRWLCFRISLGAGLIKIRGSSCWKEKTCLYYHFETQPLPSPFSFMFHFLPKKMLYHAVDLDLFAQCKIFYLEKYLLVLTFLLFVVYSVWMVLVPGVNKFGRYIRNMGGCIQVLFMVNIMLSGNYAFLNHVTIIPALACIDDSCYPLYLQRLFHKNIPHTPNYGMKRLIQHTIDIILLLTISYLSLPVISNLLQLEGKHQIMNTSFNAFRLVNTYGAFGSVGKARYEPILSLSPDGKTWTEIDFPCKPGTITRRPCLCAPYHYRLDWNIWFIGFEPHSAYLQRREQWLYILIIKMLSYNDREPNPWLDLIDKSSALHYVLQQKSTVFKYAKVDMYHYSMSKSLGEIVSQYYSNDEVIWWNRSFKESLIPPVLYDKRREKLYLAQGN